MEPETETLPPTEPETETLPPTEPETETLPPTEPETETLPPTEPEPEPVPQPIVITLTELLSSQEALLAKEKADRINLLTISNPNIVELRPKLLSWASKGFPENYSVLSFPLAAPSSSSDGVARSLNDYIVFCSGKSIGDHIASFQQVLDGIQAGFVYGSGVLSVVVSRSL